MNVSPTPNVWLARFAKLVVLATFALILVGGHTTTSGAGMAFPDWPLSHGSLNPDGWWENLAQRLEHGHRILAETVGLLVGILCAWTWRSKWAVPAAAGISVLLALGAKLSGAPREVVMHVGLWSSVAVFSVMIVAASRGPEHLRSASVRWLTFFAFLGVCAQAVMGGLRVTIESGGNAQVATLFRIAHGCFAQLELCLLVVIAALLSPAAQRTQWKPQFRKISALAWGTALAVYIQLIVGASMRHFGAGLAISSFPHATPDGHWMPAVHNFFVDLNFTHTRFGAAVVSLLVLWLVFQSIRNSGGEIRVILLAVFLGVLLFGQVLLGMLVIWKMRPPIVTTLHVVNGAALLASTVLLAIRTSRRSAWQLPEPDSYLHPPFTRIQA